VHKVTKTQIINAIHALGVGRGDCLLVHSALQYLGRPENGVHTYLSALITCTGPEGTIAVPTFNFDFAKGERFNPQETPSIGMGIFSEYIRQLPEAQRTTHPMQSIAVLGRYSDSLVECDTPSAFDPGSAFERMLDLDFKILLLGADVNAISLLHLSEQRNQVPYRYWKDFIGEVLTDQGWQSRTYRMYVRDMDLDPKLDLKPVQKRLENQGKWASLPINYGFVSLCRARDFVSIVDEVLSRDPWALVTNR